jgi:large subunit ribosomal protein L21
MEGYAVVEAGGKQYLVKAGDVLKIEKLDAEQGSKVDLGRVLAVSDGNTLQIGTPDIKDAKVLVSIENHVRGPKLRIFKKRRRKTYARRAGHRQNLTVVKVESISR